MSEIEIAAVRRYGEDDERDAALRQLGAPVGLELARVSAHILWLGTVAKTRKERTYAAFGMTWAEYCRRILGRHSDAVEEELRSLDRLGDQLFAAAQLAGLGRDGMRLLRAVPSGGLPEVSDGRLLMDGREVPIDEQNRGLVAELLAEVIDRERGDRKDAEAARDAAKQEKEKLAREIDALKATIATGTADNERLRETVNGIDLLRGEITGRDKPIDETLRRLLQVNTHLALIAADIAETRPDPQLVLRAVQPLQYMLSRIIRYAGGAEDAPAPAQDSALDFAAAEQLPHFDEE